MAIFEERIRGAAFVGSGLFFVLGGRLWQLRDATFATMAATAMWP
jgi:hypothetical protein